jgi:hypothetical protein
MTTEPDHNETRRLAEEIISRLDGNDREELQDLVDEHRRRTTPRCLSVNCGQAAIICLDDALNDDSVSWLEDRYLSIRARRLREKYAGILARRGLES